MISPNLFLDELRKECAMHANPDKAVQQQAYSKSALQFWGISKPMLEKLSKPLIARAIPPTAAAYQEMIIFLTTNATHREEWYVMLLYARRYRIRQATHLETYTTIIRMTQWWDIVDDSAANLVGYSLREVPERSCYLLNWITDTNLWVRRTAILAQLKYKEATDKELLATLVLTVAHEKQFFMRKAIGWALREYAKTDAAWVKEFVSAHKQKLSPLSVKEALKHHR